MKTRMLFLFFFLGVLAGVALHFFTNKDRKLKCRYDERQKLVQGRAYKYAFFTLIFYYVFHTLSNVFFEKKWADDIFAMVLGICIAVGVNSFYCIWHEGYISLNENPKRVKIVFALLAIANFFMGATGWKKGLLVKDGMLTGYCSNIACASLLLFILAVLAAKRLSVRREEE